jgi:ABC-type molybdate transport system substrate-binding protein
MPILRRCPNNAGESGLMRTIRLLSGALCLVGAMTAANAGAAELKVLSAEAMKPALQELASAFEKKSGNKVKVEYATDANGEKQVASDDSIDVAILPKDSITKLVNSARLLTFPKELAKGSSPEVEYVAGSSLLTEEPLAAKALMDFLASPEAKKVYEAKGLKTG